MKLNPLHGKLLSRVFHAGISLKGIDGILELIGGGLLWFVPLSKMDLFVRALFAHELSRDPDDFIATHMLHASAQIANSDPLFASAYLISHGLVKVILVAALWMNQLWAYPLTIFVFSAFMIYQTYRFAHTHSPAMLLLTLFDAAVVYLTWAEYREQKALRTRSVLESSIPG